jgi:hypothetical protein
MGGTTINKDFPDRSRLSIDDYYEIDNFARENGISPSKVRWLMKRNGGDRMILIQAAKELRERNEKFAATGW